MKIIFKKIPFYISSTSPSTIAGNSPSILNIFYSTSPSVNQLYNTNLRIPFLQSAEFDDNSDGKSDRLEVSVVMPTMPGEKINAVSGLLYHEVRLSDTVRYVYDAATFINYEGATPIEKVSFDGDITIKQTWPFSSKGGYVI